MLQIGSGKLFQREVEYKNHLRGVIYTNLRIPRERKIETDAGSLLPTSPLTTSLALVYEFTELIESHGNGPGALISHGIDPYLTDFSSILSFALNCIATSDYELTNRLITGKRGPSTPEAPNKLVKRVFDREILSTPYEEQHLVNFTKHLIGLERGTFLGVIRAIRTYVTGIHRIADDVELAYTLLVASIESLAQDFDEHEATWDDLDEQKRNRIDRALSAASDETANSVRNAILDIEHNSLAHRFRTFTLSHLDPTFFREEVDEIVQPVTKEDLPSALNQAYRARSQYIHNLRELPRILTSRFSFSETCRVNRKTWLTLQGLSRVARHVIVEFINRQPTIDKQIYNYSLERAGIVQAPMAPQYWVGNVKGINRRSAPKRLEGFLDQLGSSLLNEPNSSITDLTSVLEESEKLIPSIKKSERIPFIALYFLFNGFLPEEERMPGLKKIEEQYQDELSEPTPEALFVNLLFDAVPKWDLETHEAVINRYHTGRERKSGFRAPRVLEAGILLELAERHRLNSNIEQTKKFVSMAVENYPEHKRLRDFEIDFLSENSPISWTAILLPAKETSDEAEDRT